MSEAAAGFLNDCAGSGLFKGYLSQVADQTATQGTICSCLTGDLVGKVGDADLTILARDFTTTDSTVHPASENYGRIAQVAQDSLRACMRQAGITPDF
jgi:hypothetical protein